MLLLVITVCPNIGKNSLRDSYILLLQHLPSEVGTF